jgi:hypothetical protein
MAFLNGILDPRLGAEREGGWLRWWRDHCGLSGGLFCLAHATKILAKKSYESETCRYCSV